MANKKLPGGRKSAGRVSTSAKKLVALKAGTVGVAISELPEAKNLTGEERFPVVQDKETRSASVEQIKELMPSGKDGASAYEVWAEAQPEGADTSEAAFLEYMHGKDGEDGTGITVEGITAKNGNIVLSPDAHWTSFGSSQNSVFYPEYLNKAVNGTYKITAMNGGVVNVNLAQWNSLFNERQNIRILCQCESGEAEIFFTPPANGGIYFDDGTVYDSQKIKFDSGYLVFEIYQIPHRSDLVLKKLLPVKPGGDGLSAYEVWVNAQEPEADVSLEAYLAFQEGKDGKSAYQIWLDEGNEGTEADFLTWLRVNASVNVDPHKTNLVENNADGLYVNGTHPIIPKLSTSTLNGLLDTFKSLADGTRIYTMQVDLTNPLGITQLGDVGIHRYLTAEPQYFFTNENGEYIPAQYFITGSDVTASSVKVTISVIMPDKPYKSWNLSTLEEVASIEGGSILQCEVGVWLVAGTTPSQNGMN
ncbi:hypothetical protein [Mangrovibacter phragmitis]|uniref:hypothetical protein n=1 Tax=Mangrovibacter phragmitis TaxID=1691903 RepID=UPI003519D6A9